MEYLLQFAVAAVSTVCFGVTFQVPRRHMLACGVGGGVGWLCYVLCQAAGCSAAIATFLAALPLTLACRLFAIRVIALGAARPLPRQSRPARRPGKEPKTR